MGRPPRVSREQVLDTANRIFSAKGFAATTLADIAAELSVTPAALLRHAPTKEKLFRAALTGGQGREAPPFLEELEKTPASADPHIVLRRLAEAFVPFVRVRLEAYIASYFHASATGGSIVLPVGPQGLPARVIKALENYLRRATRGGSMSVRNPRAAAIAFLGSLHFYLFSHFVLRIAEEPLPLDRHLDQLIEIWSEGAIKRRNPARRKPRPAGGRRART